MSDLIDRYLAAVAALLPKASRQDIVAELRDLIMNRVEEQEAAKSRPLDKKEMEALLREIGHPIAVAGRYGPHKALIGPELYPFWAFGVKVALAIAAIAALVPAAIVLVTGQGGFVTIGAAMDDFIPNALSLIGCATLIGAAIERGWIKVGDFKQWKVSDLPVIPPGQGKGWFSKSRFEGLFELIVMLLFIGWWSKLLPFPMGQIIHADGNVGIVLSPVLNAMFWPILALAILQAISSLILVVKPGLVRPRAAVELLGAVGGLAVLAVLWPAQPLLTFVSPGGADVARLQEVVDLSFKICLAVTAGISLIKLFVEGRRLVLGR